MALYIWRVLTLLISGFKVWVAIHQGYTLKDLGEYQSKRYLIWFFELKTYPKIKLQSLSLLHFLTLLSKLKKYKLLKCLKVSYLFIKYCIPLHFDIDMFLIYVGFAATELCVRIQHAEPKVIIAASCGIEPSRIVE